jgi:DNA-directed RNA polymerase subunit alpha
MSNKKKHCPFIFPEIVWEKETKKDYFVTNTVSVEPLEPGFGVTFGNSLRRVLLGGIEGSAVTSVCITGVNNECSVIPGVIDDTMTIILNCKKLIIKNTTGEAGILYAKKSGSSVLIGSDFSGDKHLKVLNENIEIAQIAEDGEIEIKLFVSTGRGYKYAMWPKNESLQEDGRIYIDSTFTPVRNVSIDIQKTRVGDNIDYDKLLLSITTDGSITPEESFEHATSIIIQQFESFIKKENIIEFPENNYKQKQGSISFNVEDSKKDKENEQKKTPEEFVIPDGVSPDFYLKSIDILGLPVRVHNCLIGSGIQRVIDLVNIEEQTVSEMKNFGRKSYEDLKQIMKEFGLYFNMNLDEKKLLKLMEKKNNESSK